MKPVVHAGIQDASRVAQGAAGVGDAVPAAGTPPLQADSREFYRQIVETTQEGIWMADLVGTTFFANASMARMLGCPVQELIGRSVFDFVFEADHPVVRQHFAEFLAGPAGVRVRERLRRSDGTELWTLVEASVCRNTEHRPVGFLGMFTDVTDHKRAEDALQTSLATLETRVRERTAELQATNAALTESELKFRRLFETISDAAFIFDGTTRQLLEVNDAALQLYGYTRQEFLALRQTALTAEPEETEGIIQLVMAGARPRIPLRYHRRKDGTVFPAEIAAGAFVLRNRTLVCGVIRDITSRRLAEEALQRREQELADFFADSPLGLMWVAPGGRIQRVNQAQLVILGCRGEAVYGQPVTQFHADPGEAAELLRRLSRHETVREFRGRMVRPDGTTREVLIDANGLWEEDSLVHSRWFVRDITHSMNLEREILEISERERHRLGRDLHDDLCQQLVGIEFLCQRLASRLGTDVSQHADATEIARMVQRALAQGRELARGLSPVSLAADGLTEALRSLAARTRQVFRVDCRFRSPGTPLVQNPMVAGHLYRVAQEAVTNALKHGKAGRIDIRLSRGRKGTRLGVHDNGIGLPTEQTKPGGMGLSIMRYRAEVMGGSLKVTGGPGRGTRVQCIVPEAIAAGETGGTHERTTRTRIAGSQAPGAGSG